jgi:predicted enzyme related to lactoylglutathione lyase
MKKVTGIGGIFFKCQDPEKVRQWYADHLGFNTDAYGTCFEWRQAETGEKGFSQWSTFPADTKYFEPSSNQYMINYRVEDLVALVDQLKSGGITIVDEIQEFEYGKFVHILDIEGNKIELWQPDDEEFEKIATATTK